MWAWLEDKAGTIYRDWKWDFSRHYKKYGRQTIPPDLIHRQDEWDWLCWHFESPDFKVNLIEISIPFTKFQFWNSTIQLAEVVKYLVASKIMCINLLWSHNSSKSNSKCTLKENIYRIGIWCIGKYIVNIFRMIFLPAAPLLKYDFGMQYVGTFSSYFLRAIWCIFLINKQVVRYSKLVLLEIFP